MEKTERWEVQSGIGVVILYWAIREGLFNTVTLSKPLKEVREGALQVSGRRALWAKGLREDHASKI